MAFPDRKFEARTLCKSTGLSFILNLLANCGLLQVIFVICMYYRNSKGGSLILYSNIITEKSVLLQRSPDTPADRPRIASIGSVSKRCELGC